MSVRGSWRPLNYGLAPLIRWPLLMVQGLLIYVAASRGIGYLAQPPQDNRHGGTFFIAAGADVHHPAVWGTALLAGACLFVLGHVVFCRPALSAAGHGLIGVTYLSLGWFVLLANPLNAGLFLTGVMHLGYVAALGSSIGWNRGAARQTEG